MSLLKGFFGSKGGITSREEELLRRVNAFESEVSVLEAGQFPERTELLRKRYEGGETLDDLLPEAFALTREAAKRTLGQRHFDVQILGGIVLHQGKIAEMKTGEGKTLVATLPVYLNSLSGHGVHVVTVNDYLARRDAVWMGQIYAFLGLTVGVINHDTSYRYDASAKPDKDHERDESGSYKVVYDFLRPGTRAEAYGADITYGTNNEYGFDYLRDNIAYRREDVVQREHNFVIVDEVDSILIDEARTPLIISAPVGEAESLYPVFAKIARTLKRDEDYTVDEKLRAITLTDGGIEKTEKVLGVGNIYTDQGIKYVHHLETAVRAQALFERDKEYVVRGGEVIIVDTFTGRLQPGRRYSDGLHQAIEAKEGVKVKEESRTFATVSFQNYFRLYKKLSGMTGTAFTSAEEFSKVYGLETVAIPTNKPGARVDRDDLVFQTENGKFTAAVRKIKELHEKGTPVLVGTASIEKSETLAARLGREGIAHEVLNAKNHEREGEIIARAGERGRVTISTNMAGRGVDIKLGGVHASTEEYEAIKNFGGLFVLGTERHEARRIDNQLRGRSGRQGDPGETQFYESLEDPLMRIFGPGRIKNMMGRFGIPEDEPIQNRLVTKAIESAQEKIEGFNFDARKHLLEYDDVMNHQRGIIYAMRRKVLMGDHAILEEFIGELLAENEESEKLSATIEEKRKSFSDERFFETLRMIALRTIDMFWVEHLEAMEHMRGSVNLRAYGQRDPLVEYKKEGLRLFKDLEHSIRAQILHFISSMNDVGGSADSDEKKLKEVHERANLIVGDRGQSNKVQSQSEGPKIGRNDPCPCGAVDPATVRVYKYKKCGFINAPHHKQL